MRTTNSDVILTRSCSLSSDSRKAGLNGNVLVLGCSGSGKTRNHLKPNLMQCDGSYIVLDSKGSLYDEMGPFLETSGYEVDKLDFTTFSGTVGYNPLDYVRWHDGDPVQQDMIAIASAVCPAKEHKSDPFWPRAAANYLTSYIAFVFEMYPQSEWTMNSVIEVFEKACVGESEMLFGELERRRPKSYAVSLYKRAKSTARADRMHSSIMGIIAAYLLPFGFESARASYSHPRRIDFEKFAQGKHALFVTIDDMDRSLDGLTSLFVRQAFTSLADYADHQCANHALPIPVRFMLDDFANLHLPAFDDILSVTRSRNIAVTVICQTVSQLEARYNEATANSIIGNCDTQLVLAFQDERTARYFALRANKSASTLLETPLGKWWLFVRGSKGKCDESYRLEDHPRYGELRRLTRPQTHMEESFDVYEPWEEIDPRQAALFVA